MEASITLKKVAKIIQGEAILSDLSVGIEKGSTFVLVGENGSGKSMFLRILAGLIEKDAGSVYMNGIDTSTRGSETRILSGYMPQCIDLDPDLTILENISLYGQLHGLSREKSNNRVVNLLHDFKMIKYKNEFHKTLSKGQMRVVQYMRAIVHDPDILLLDEPTKEIDPHYKKMIWKNIDKMHNQKTIVFVTQDFREAERYAERIAILYNGNIQMDGSLDKLIETTKGLSRYRLFFKDEIQDDFIEEIKASPRIVKAKINGRELEFYSRERSEFFKVLKLALEYQISDIDTSLCSLQDLFMGLTDGGLE